MPVAIAVTEAGLAQKITAALKDDLDGGLADETVRSGIRGAEYEIDLSNKKTTAFPPSARTLHRACPQGWQRTALPAWAYRSKPGAPH